MIIHQPAVTEVDRLQVEAQGTRVRRGDPRNRACRENGKADQFLHHSEYAIPHPTMTCASTARRSILGSSVAEIKSKLRCLAEARTSTFSDDDGLQFSMIKECRMLFEAIVAGNEE